jgi:tripartite-type tricarboxylate transporter receptor subunit TctC
MRKASYHPVNDVTPICLLVSDPRLFVVRADDNRFSTPQEYLKYAKENPEKLTIGTSGAGTSGHLSLLFMNKAAGVRAKHVGFGGAGESKAAFLGGHIDSVTQTYGEVLGMLKDKKVKIIAAATETRMAELPNVPTFKEAGIDLVISSNRGIAGPKGLPRPIVEKLADAFKKASMDPEYLKQMEKMGLPSKYLGPEEFAKLVKTEYEEYTEISKELGLDRR